MSAAPDRPWDDQPAAAHDKLAWHLADRWRGLKLRPGVRRWLIDSGFATVEPDGSLRPTPLGVEVGRALDDD